jgi:hypothetical protein
MRKRSNPSARAQKNTSHSLTSHYLIWNELGTWENLISLVCLVLNAIALVRCRKLENLDVMNGEVVGVFIAPTTKSGRWEAVCRMAHRTVRCATRMSGAPATSPGRWVLTVGALTGGASGLSGGAPDKSCRLSGAPSTRALTLARTVAHLMRLQSTVGAK